MDFTSTVLNENETPTSHAGSTPPSIKNKKKINKNIFKGRTIKYLYETIRTQRDIYKWFSSSTDDNTKGAMLESLFKLYGLGSIQEEFPMFKSYSLSTQKFNGGRAILPPETKKLQYQLIAQGSDSSDIHFVYHETKSIIAITSKCDSKNTYNIPELEMDKINSVAADEYKNHEVKIGCLVWDKESTQKKLNVAKN